MSFGRNSKIAAGLLGFVALAIGSMSFYTVEEGHVGIVKHFSEAQAQENPGLRFKVPFMDTVEMIEIRTRKNVEKMTTATSEQMPVSVEVSVNWTVNKEAALDMYRKYGGLSQFEQRILDPRFRAATKEAIPHYTAEHLIQNRSQAIKEIEDMLTEEMAGYPVKVDNVQIENIGLPDNYLKSIEAKQTAKNLADAEKFNLEKQKLEAQRGVNLDQAKADGTRLVASADAEAIRIKGEAEAYAIKVKAQALRDNPLIIQLTQAQSWDGKLPQTMLGSGAVPFIDVAKAK